MHYLSYLCLSHRSSNVPLMAGFLETERQQIMCTDLHALGLLRPTAVHFPIFNMPSWNQFIYAPEFLLALPRFNKKRIPESKHRKVLISVLRTDPLEAQVCLNQQANSPDISERQGWCQRRISQHQ